MRVCPEDRIAFSNVGECKGMRESVCMTCA